jgi:hypothetical protein
MNRTIFVLVAVLLGQIFGQDPPQRANQIPGSGELSRLHEMGLQIIGAVMTEDTGALLSFDRPDLRADDTRALTDSHSSLSCFLFNDQCVQKGSRTVRQSLISPRKLRIAVQMPSNQRSGIVSAALIFYDGSRGEIPGEKLCDSGLVRETWTFKWTGTGWVSARPMFDNETDGWCGGAF